MKPTRSAKSTETSRRSAAGRSARGRGGAARSRRPSGVPHSPQNARPARSRAPQDGQPSASGAAALGAELPALAVLGCRSSGRSRARPPARRRRRPPAPATASRRAARRSRAPRRRARSSARRLAVLQQRDGEAERELELAEERLRRPGTGSRRRLSFARKRCACASSSRGRSPGRSDSIVAEQLLDLRRVAGLERRLERLDEAQLHRQERRSRASAMAATPTSAAASASRGLPSVRRTSASRVRDTRCGPAGRPRSSSRRVVEAPTRRGDTSPRAQSTSTHVQRRAMRPRPAAPARRLSAARERLVPSSEEHERADRTER